MKDRILAYLNDFANGIDNELTQELQESLRLDDLTFRQYAQEAQSAILHKYAQFSISTIDAFFQKVIRSFTREAGLVGDYRLEVDQTAVLEEVIDNLVDELGTNKELTDWVVEFAKENLENERAWDVRSSLIDFAEEIFKDEFKDIETVVNTATADRSYFTDLRSALWKQKNFFLTKGETLAKQAIDIMELAGLQPSDIKYGKTSGLFGFLDLYAFEKNLTKYKPPVDRITGLFSVAKNWPSPTCSNPQMVIQLAETKIIPLLKELVALYENHFNKSLSAQVVLDNLYVFGLVADISRKLREYKDENNLMLLADAPKFLNGVIQDSDTPFIYEKVGSFYKNFLIDEFQDTSSMQWKNFLPLLVNSLDQGYTSLVVGDVKQAIYRWRGGDLKLLQQEIEGHIGQERVEIRELSSNYRSAITVVNFNNLLFEKAAAVVALETNHPISTEAYHDVGQKTTRPEEGFVDVTFIPDDPELKWKNQALHKIPGYLEQLQSMGASLKDIAILVRKNEEGQEIVAHLLDYKHSSRAKPGFGYDVVSNESLRLDGAATVNLLLGAMKYLLNPDDVIARAQLSYEFSKLYEPERNVADVFSVTNHSFFESNLPPAFTKDKGALKKLPLFELTETLISIFKLGEHAGEIAYLLAFQNQVLEFYSRERNDLGAFLEWWEDNKNKKSIQVSGEVNAVQILTIHKAKGLQFKYVIIPFCSWNQDHDPLRAPNLWVTSDQPPFAEVGFTPVKYSSNLKNTYFDDYYLAERTRCYLDNLNLLYVAFTRAEQGLIIMAPETKNAKQSVAYLLKTSLLQSYSENDYWNESKNEFKIGKKIHAGSSKQVVPADALTLKSYASFRWRDKLVMRLTAAPYLNQPAKQHFEKINYGIYIHTILSRIKYANEIQDTLDRIILEGLITHDQRESLNTQLMELMANPQIASWFDTSWDVRTEIPILLPGGAENRIDRLLIRDKKVIVVDFKTGEPVKTDQRQIQDYIDILHKMNFADVQGYLLYIKKGEVVSVPQGKVRSVKTRDEQQLGLGF